MWSKFQQACSSAFRQQKSRLLHGDFVHFFVVEVPSSASNALMAPFRLDGLTSICFYVQPRIGCPTDTQMKCHCLVLPGVRHSFHLQDAWQKMGSCAPSNPVRWWAIGLKSHEVLLLLTRFPVVSWFVAGKWNWRVSPFLMSQTIRPFFEDIVLGVSSWRVLPQWRQWSPWELQQRSWALQDNYS